MLPNHGNQPIAFFCDCDCVFQTLEEVASAVPWRLAAVSGHRGEAASSVPVVNRFRLRFVAWTSDSSGKRLIA
jgi:hypothetical protein